MQPNSGPRSGHGGPPRREDEDLASLLKPPAERFRYFSANNSTAPRPEMLDREAQEVARALASLPSSQLRRFYSAVMALKRQIELDSQLPDEMIRARLALLKAQASYTWKRREREYPRDLVTFFTRHADAVRSRQDFLRGFQPHFEAVIAFHKVFERKTRGERE
jgi:CRISPR type III-A-associated protein Csm2